MLRLAAFLTAHVLLRRMLQSIIVWLHCSARVWAELCITPECSGNAAASRPLLHLAVLGVQVEGVLRDSLVACLLLVLTR